MRKQQRMQLYEIYHISIVVAILFLLFISAIYLTEKTGRNLTGAVIGKTGTNASLTLFDDGDIRPNTFTGDIEINTLFNDTSNVYFYANYTNGTGQAVPASGTTCNIEYAADAGGNRGPFAMSRNATLSIFQYNRSYPQNGTFAWNVTCQNPTIGTATLIAYDSVRIFGRGCTSVGSGLLWTNITNNTVLCGGTTTSTPGSLDRALLIQNNNITVDCNGTIFRTTNNGAVGITIGPFNGTIIKGCVIENFTNGIITSSIDFKSEAFLFNNSFANNTAVQINFTKAGNITLRNNTITNTTGVGIWAENVTNMTVISNSFCRNAVTLVNSTSNITTANNTLCITLISPGNATRQSEINFTFRMQSLLSNRTCDIITPTSILSGRTIVQNTLTDALDANITLNVSFYNNQTFNWQVNCTDTENNKDLSVLFNVTEYKACTVPTLIQTAPQENITFCPGTFEMNDSGTGSSYMTLSKINDTIIQCNNTILRGNSLTNFITIDNGTNRLTVRHCTLLNFSRGIETRGPGINTNNFTIYNNSFINLSSFGVNINGPVGFNFTNNTFRNIVGIGIALADSRNITFMNNTIINTSAEGLTLFNLSNSTIIWNNISITGGPGIYIHPSGLGFLPTSRPVSTNLIANNTICGASAEGFLANETFYNLSPIMDGLINNNTFCNATTGNANRDVAKLIWSIEVNVVNRTNTSIVNANVNITDTFNRNITSDLLTNASGLTTPLTNITQYIVNNTGQVVNFTPITIVAAKNAEKSNLTISVDSIRIAGITDMGAIILNLSQDATAPNVTQIRPASGIENTYINFTAMVNDTVGIQSCSFFLGNSLTDATNRGTMTYSLGDGIVNITFLVGSAGTYLGYANCTDNGNNIGFNATTILITPATSGNGGEDDGGGAGGGPAPETTVAPVTETTPVQEQAPVTETSITEQEAIEEKIVEKQEEVVESENAYENIFINTILEAWKGKLTIQKIIEEIKEIVIRTYKILLLLLLIPILLLLRATTIVDEHSLRRMIEDKKINEYWRIYVSKECYIKYNMFQNIKPVAQEDSEIQKANALAKENNLSYELSSLILFANKKLIPRIFTMEDVSKELRHKYPRILFTSPTKNFREDQLQRYIETEQSKGFTNNEIRETLSRAKWKPEIIKKYLDPEKDLEEYIKTLQQKGKTLGEIRKQLLEVHWKKEIINRYLPRDKVLKEYIDRQRKDGKPNSMIRKAVLEAGWEKELVNTLLNPEKDLKIYIVAQHQKGISDEEIKQKLFANGWGKESIATYLK